MVEACHVISAHGIRVEQYREMFRLFGNVSTAAPETSERKRRSMLDEIATGATSLCSARRRRRRSPGGARWRCRAPT
ncbi:MAG: hypothetical protein M3076_05065 [Actinomycetota bacterium]|nr:hypothetical protein [Actinomycetota bacterium]